MWLILLEYIPFGIRFGFIWCDLWCHIYFVVLVTKSYLTLLQPCGLYSLPGSSVLGISQAKILEWVAISFFRGSSQPRDWMSLSCIGRWILCHWDTRKHCHLCSKATWDMSWKVNLSLRELIFREDCAEREGWNWRIFKWWPWWDVATMGMKNR